VPLTCPACNKAGQTEAACQRCGCDLSRLHTISATAAVRLEDARAALEEFDWSAAQARAAESWRLRHSPEAARLAFLAAVGSGETAATLRWRRRALAATGG
jgi:hypothetical protein